jgi:hypothetical protein
MKTIIAQSGAGKTTFCRKHKWCLDGDNLNEIQHVYTHLGRQHGEDWQTTLFKSIEPEYIALMKAAERKLSGRNIWVAISCTLFANPSSIFVIPPPGVVSRQLSRPRAGHLAKHDSDRAKWANMDRKTYIKAATQLKALVLPSFDALDKAVVL